MTHETPNNSVRKLDALLDAERAALLEGRLENVGSMLEEKSRLIAALDGPGDREELDQLSGKVRRNQQLLEGSLEGVRRVTERLEALRRVRDRFDTYGPDGKRRVVNGEQRSSVEKRA